MAQQSGSGNTTKNAVSLAKTAAHAASGNYVAAAIDVIENPKLFGGILAVTLTIILLLFMLPVTLFMRVVDGGDGVPPTITYEGIANKDEWQKKFDADYETIEKIVKKEWDDAVKKANEGKDPKIQEAYSEAFRKATLQLGSVEESTPSTTVSVNFTSSTDAIKSPTINKQSKYTKPNVSLLFSMESTYADKLEKKRFENKNGDKTTDADAFTPDMFHYDKKIDLIKTIKSQTGKMFSVEYEKSAVSDISIDRAVFDLGWDKPQYGKPVHKRHIVYTVSFSVTPQFKIKNNLNTYLKDTVYGLNAKEYQYALERAKNLASMIDVKNTTFGTEMGHQLSSEEIQAVLDRLPPDLPGWKRAAIEAGLSVVGAVPYMLASPATAPGIEGIPTAGMDCGNFVTWCYWTGRGNLPDQWFNWTNCVNMANHPNMRAISREEAEPGDIMLSINYDGHGSNHAVLFMGFADDGSPAFVESCYGYGTSINMSTSVAYTFYRLEE